MPSMKEVPTYEAKIYVGYDETNGYGGRMLHNTPELTKICQDYCDQVGLCVTITEIKFVYTKGKEHGAIIGLINYPRFPSDNEQIRAKAIALANIFLVKFGQKRISIVCSDRTIMIGDDEDE